MDELYLKQIKIGVWLVLAVAAMWAVYEYHLSVRNNFPALTFSVDGTGDIDTVPDLATFSATVTSEGGNSVADVQSANSDKMNRINTYLKDQGIDPKDLKTTQYDLSPRYSTFPPCYTSTCPTQTPTIIGYSLTQTLQVKVRDNSKLSDLLSGVVTSGANTVSSVQFVVDDDSAAKDAARVKAIADAKRKAGVIAQQAGLRLGRLITYYENNTTPEPQMGYGGSDAGATMKANAAPVVEPGTNKTTVGVTLTYELR